MFPIFRARDTSMMPFSHRLTFYASEHLTLHTLVLLTNPFFVILSQEAKINVKNIQNIVILDSIDRYQKYEYQ